MNDGAEITDVAPGARKSLEAILEESFEGLYLWHAKKTLREIELVRAARIDGEYAGLAMLKSLSIEVGYVYYIAVARKHRRKRIGGKLLGASLEYFSQIGTREVYASITEGNIESEALFESVGFRRTNRAELSKRFGLVRTFEMYRRMLVVPGESLFRKELKM